MSKIAATHIGKKVFKDIKSGDMSYETAKINQDEWAYLGFLIEKHYIDTEHLTEEYGTEGEKIFRKLIHNGYVMRI